MFTPKYSEFGTCAIVTYDEFVAMMGDDSAIISRESRLKVNTRGAWGIVGTVRGLCVKYNKDHKHSIIGIRSMTNVKECGYELEGRVSVDGEKLRAFTSSMIFEISDILDERGRSILVSVGILFC